MPDLVVKLAQIAHARSGDKGNHANLGVVAYTPLGYAFLVENLTTEVVASFFSGLGLTKVERFELPRVGALNFLLYNAFEGGASRALRIDTQGKLLGTAALEIELPAPRDASEMGPPASNRDA